MINLKIDKANKELIIFPKNKQGFISPCYMISKVNPDLDNGF